MAHLRIGNALSYKITEVSNDSGTQITSLPILPWAGLPSPPTGILTILHRTEAVPELRGDWDPTSPRPVTPYCEAT